MRIWICNINLLFDGCERVLKLPNYMVKQQIYLYVLQTNYIVHSKYYIHTKYLIT